MSSEGNQNNSDDETSRHTEESSSQNCSNQSSNPSSINNIENTDILLISTEIKSLPRTTVNNSLSIITPGSDSDDMKRAIAKKLIERYFYQLSDGCGNPKCANRNCASSGEVEKLTPNQAAARALQLYAEDAELCELHPSKVQRTQLDNVANRDTESTTSNKLCDASGTSSSRMHDQIPNTSNSSHINLIAHTGLAVSSDDNNTLNEDILMRLIDEAKIQQNQTPLIRVLGRVFSSIDYVAASFQQQPIAHLDAILDKAPHDLKTLKKEDFRSIEGDLDKDEDSCAENEPTVFEPHHTKVDLISLRRVIGRLYETNSVVFEPLSNALSNLAITLRIDLRIATQKEKIEEMLTVFVIVFEIIVIGSSEFLDNALPKICQAVTNLPMWAQARLAWIWAIHCKCILHKLLETLQQFISLQVIAGNYHQHSHVQDNDQIVSATKVLKILYYASIISGKLDSPKMRDEEPDETDDEQKSFNTISEDDSFFGFSSFKPAKQQTEDDPLELELEVCALDSRKPFIPFEEFYNEPLSEVIEMDNDYLNYKNGRSDYKKFSFMLYSFILTPVTKVLGLYFDCRIRMYSERRISNIHNRLSGQPANPYLKIKVRRDHIIDDALVEVEMIALGNPKDLKKQLVIEFADEQGVDEGGVSKEFFQLIVEQIFNPDYGMFIHQEETRTVWFNSTSFENEAQFTLIGIVVGLAIYNNIILAVNFPMVVYRKLMGIKGSFNDLEDFNPTLYKSLTYMLAYDESDMEDVFMQTFRISYRDVFGNTLTHDLKPDGDVIMVNQENKQEFVDLYTEFLLNTSVNKQFKAFRRGFQMVTGESPLHLLFRPEEVELLVCGSKDFDFVEMEKSTEYEGGYTKESQVIIDFWDIVHALPMESKKKLLEFATGSDRVPVGGLSRLKFVISRNGPDSDRLPTAHTCFNVLLLPEYSTKTKLEDRLSKAINYSKGFGMI